MNALVPSPRRNPVAALLARASEKWRRANASNAVAFEELGAPIVSMPVRLGLADRERPVWERLYLRLWRWAYVRHGVGLPTGALGREERARASPSDAAWLEEIVRAYAPESGPRGALSGYPTAELQVNTVGYAGPAALSTAYRFWIEVKEECRTLGVPLGATSRILDFGCGWGRIARFFFRDTPASHVTGIDVDADFVALCRRIMSGGDYRVVSPMPPTDLEAGTFDLVVGYSVLSHLSEPAAAAWMAEFARVLKPGGVVAVTTRSRPFLAYWESFARVPDASPHFKLLSTLFPDFDEARRRYDAGEFLFVGLHGGGVRAPSFYGEAFIPEGYARRAWGPGLSFRKFAFDPSRHELALIVMQKPNGGAA